MKPPHSNVRPLRETAAAKGAYPIPTIPATGIWEPLPPIPWLCHGLALTPGRPACIAGYGYAGKTLIAQALALAVASGRPLFGLWETSRGRVLHLDYEQGRHMTCSRYQRLSRGAGIDAREVADRLDVAIHPTVHLTDARGEDTWTSICDGVSLLIVDALVGALQGLDEYKPEIAEPLYMLSRVSERTGCTCVVLHHARKPPTQSGPQQGGARMALRGSSALYGALDNCWIVSGEKHKPIMLTHEKSAQDGQARPDFGLTVRDVELAGDPRWGLRLIHLDGEQLRGNEELADQDAQDRVRRAIEAVLRVGPFRGSKDALRQRAGVGRAPFVSAFRQLRDDGRIAIGGSYHDPVMTWHG